MKVAISGASGFIGQKLCTYLVQNGHSVVRLVRDEDLSVGPDCCWWHPERGIQQSVKLQDVEAVVHLAGRSIADRRWSASEKALIRSSRVEATKRLCMDLARLDAPPGIFISASAVGIYGDCGDTIVTETHGAGNDFLAKTAVDWEAASTVLADAGTRIAQARFGVVLAPHAGALKKMLPIFRWGLGGVLGSGRQYWSWIGIDDAIQGLVWLLLHQASGPYNLVAPSAVTNAEFTRQLAMALNRPAYLPVPAIALRWVLGEMADAALLASCRAIPQRLLESGFQFSSPSLFHALRGLIVSTPSRPEA